MYLFIFTILRQLKISLNLMCKHFHKKSILILWGLNFFLIMKTTCFAVSLETSQSEITLLGVIF